MTMRLFEFGREVCEVGMVVFEPAQKKFQIYEKLSGAELVPCNEQPAVLVFFTPPHVEIDLIFDYELKDEDGNGVPISINSITTLDINAYIGSKFRVVIARTAIPVEGT